MPISTTPSTQTHPNSFSTPSCLALFFTMSATPPPGPKHAWCYYFIQNDVGESEKAPNAFRVVFEGAAPVAREVWSQFPLREHDAFHFRFKVGTDATSSAWLDSTDANDAVPLIGNKIVAKLLRLCTPPPVPPTPTIITPTPSRPPHPLAPAANLTCASRRVTALSVRGGVAGTPTAPVYTSPSVPAAASAPVAAVRAPSESGAGSGGAAKAPSAAGGASPAVASGAGAAKVGRKPTEDEGDIFGMGSGGAAGGGGRAGSARAGAAAGRSPGAGSVPVVASPGWDEDNSWQIPAEGTVMKGGGIVSTIGKVEATDEDIRGMDRSSLDHDLAEKEDLDLKTRLKMQWRRDRDREVAAAKVAEIKAREEAKKDFDDKRSESKQKLQGKFDAWALAAGGDVRPVRVLLSTMQNVLWEGHSWNAVAISDLVAAPKVKLTYRKACLVVHPDRQPASAPADRKYAADYIFNALNKSFKHFEEHELGVQ
jgi:hypothetical protein